MILNSRVHYAVNAVVAISLSSQNKTPIRVIDIANEHFIPLNYLEQILFKLKQAKLITSIRGPGGGYIINQDIYQIKISHIISALEENIKFTQCSIGKKCKKNVGTKCLTHNLWKGLSKKIINYFDEISIGNILEQTTIMT